ncbi:CaiB/BaiF CoA-transferase family protein [Sodalis sp. dw_96]|uniref:CaiB/BaiF CoA transferase family protein n=1 Tax=Sodalis sp. dw_96 TaxID=2719794 RepID=UPI001BD6DB6E|nr:CaiB/BaiF CoA-transferase family protein [Sodalis sp. dw_96]
MFIPNNQPGPLAGLKVIDLTIAMAGPLATSRMGDLGADVIKVESPSGDFSRLWPLAGYFHGGESSAFLTLNRSKRAIVIDLKQPQGLELLYRLVADADILVQNFRPKVAKRLSIDFDTLKSVNPRLVYISISGYGDQGPMVDRPGQDLLVQSFSGLAFNGGVRGEKPQPSPVYLVDTCASHLAVEAALAGYIERLRTGLGQHMKVSLLSAVMEVQIQEISTYMTSGRQAKRSGRHFVSTWMEPPYNIYQTADGWIAIAQATFPAIAEAFSVPELVELGQSRPDITDEQPYLDWRDRVCDIVSAHFLTRKTDEWLELMTALGIWVGPVMDYAQVAAHPQYQSLFTDIEHPVGGTYRTLAPSIVCQNGPAIRPAPRLGEHTVEVMAELGLGDQDIERLMQQGVIR